MAIPKLTATKNYRMFERSPENRKLTLKEHKKLYRSMKKYGFLACFPIACFRDASGKLIVKDGQHRLAAAEELGLTVHYVVIDIDFDVAEINDTPKTWKIRDYADKFAANGIESYRDGLEFASTFRLPVGVAFAILSGTTNFTNIIDTFKAGTFRVKDRSYAERVAALYAALFDLAPHIKNTRLIEACMCVCRVDGFDASRLVSGARQCREKLISYSTRDGYLAMLEEIYNFRRKNMCGLRVAALQAMRERDFSRRANAKQLDSESTEER